MAINGGSVVNNLTHTINKLRITQVDDKSTTDETSTFSNIVNDVSGSSKAFEVQINPDKYVRHNQIAYTNPRTQGKARGSQNFNHVDSETLTLNFTLDGTGVIPASVTDISSFATAAAASAVDFASRAVGAGGFTDTGYVTRRIAALKKVVYDYNSEIHETPTVVVTWGDVPSFKGKLTDLQVTYTLFTPNGAPLRADIQLTFKEHGDANGQASGIASIAGGAALGIAGALLSSPDLTHRRTIKATDKLTLLCEEIYRDPSFYWQVAQANNLTHFRQLETGSEVFFPPIER